MLIKIGNEWVAANTVTGLDWVCNIACDKKSYALYIHNDKEDYCCGRYDTKEGVIKAMDEAAEKINAAQGFKPAEEKKAVMEYTVSGTESKRGTFRCSHCGFVVLGVSAKFCPGCGREITRWE